MVWVMPTRRQRPTKPEGNGRCQLTLSGMLPAGLLIYSRKAPMTSFPERQVLLRLSEAWGSRHMPSHCSHCPASAATLRKKHWLPRFHISQSSERPAYLWLTACFGSQADLGISLLSRCTAAAPCTTCQSSQSMPSPPNRTLASLSGN